MDDNTIVGHVRPRPDESTRYYFSVNALEHAALIAALTAWQRTPMEDRRAYDEILTNQGQHRQLREMELAVLMARINSGEQ